MVLQLFRPQLSSDTRAYVVVTTFFLDVDSGSQSWY